MQKHIIKSTKNIIIFGRPGSGKGTICNMLKSDFHLNHLSTGDIMRKHIGEGTKIGIEVSKYISKGKLVPDQIAVDLVLSHWNDEASFLFDGFPRTVEQAEVLLKTVSIDAVISLDVPHSTIIDRISQRWIHAASGRTYAYDFNPPKSLGFDDLTGEALSQRADDLAEVVEKRLSEYDEKSSKVIDYLAGSNKTEVVTFTGTESKVIYPRVKEYLTTHHFS